MWSFGMYTVYALSMLAVDLEIVNLVIANEKDFRYDTYRYGDDILGS